MYSATQILLVFKRNKKNINRALPLTVPTAA